MSTEALVLLRSIDASLKVLVRVLAPGGAAAVASDRELDGQYGNPVVKFEPRDWHGPSCKGKKFSECSAEFLDLMAETLEYFAQKADEKNETTSTGKPVATYKRKDAALARGWAKRIRAGWKARNGHARATEEPSGEFGNDGAFD